MVTAEGRTTIYNSFSARELFSPQIEHSSPAYDFVPVPKTLNEYLWALSNPVRLFRHSVLAREDDFLSDEEKAKLKSDPIYHLENPEEIKIFAPFATGYLTDPSRYYDTIQVFSILGIGVEIMPSYGGNNSASFEVDAEESLFAIEEIAKRTKRQVSPIGHSNGAYKLEWLAKNYPQRMKQCVDTAYLVSAPSHITGINTSLLRKPNPTFLGTKQPNPRDIIDCEGALQELGIRTVRILSSSDRKLSGTSPVSENQLVYFNNDSHKGAMDSIKTIRTIASDIHSQLLTA